MHTGSKKRQRKHFCEREKHLKFKAFFLCQYMQLEGPLSYLPYHCTAGVKKHWALSVKTQNTTHPHTPTTQHIISIHEYTLIGVKKTRTENCCWESGLSEKNRLMTHCLKGSNETLQSNGKFWQYLRLENSHEQTLARASMYKQCCARFRTELRMPFRACLHLFFYTWLK